MRTRRLLLFTVVLFLTANDLPTEISITVADRSGAFAASRRNSESFGRVYRGSVSVLREGFVND